MTSPQEKVRHTPNHNKTDETEVKCRVVSRGVGIGRIVEFFGKKRQFFRVELKEQQIERELRRLRAAFRLAKRQSKMILATLNAKKDETQHNIFETHLIFLEDKTLITKIESVISTKKINAEWAIKIVIDKYVADYKAITDEYIRERYIDLEDVAERLLTALGGGNYTRKHLEKNSIIVARDLKPSTLIELVENQPVGIITENGGWTSHTFILARELNIPAVTGMKGIMRRVKSGDEAIVDGYAGKVIINPTLKTTQIYDAKFSSSNINSNKKELKKSSNGKLKTLDGREIKLLANLDLLKEYQKSAKYGVKDIGLYRSEFLFNQNKGYPSEKEQFENYQHIAGMTGEHRINVRTFDLGLEQLYEKSNDRENNPALGLRAIRLSLRDEKEFRVQIRALLRAAYQTNLAVVLPMVSDISEIRRARQILQSEKRKLNRRKIEHGNPPLGVMIEVPAAVWQAEEIAAEADFINIGTNDLVQYLLAVDRDNEAVADWFRTLHPAVLRAIKMVLDVGEKTKKDVIICGEMAASPVYAPIIIGLGSRLLSMNPNSMQRVGRIITNIAWEEANLIAQKLLLCKTGDECEECVRKEFLKYWKHLFEPTDLP